VLVIVLMILIEFACSGPDRAGRGLVSIAILSAITITSTITSTMVTAGELWA
jgi:hypothetical protein